MTEAELFAAYGASAREGAYSDDAFGLGTEALAAGGDWPRRSVRRPADGRHARPARVQGLVPLRREEGL